MVNIPPPPPPMPSEFHNREPPLPFGNPKSRPWYGMDIFWNRPLHISLKALNTYNSGFCGGTKWIKRFG